MSKQYTMKRVKGNDPYGDSQESLNKMFKEGWEYVAATGVSGEHPYIEYILCKDKK